MIISLNWQTLQQEVDTLKRIQKELTSKNKYAAGDIVLYEKKLHVVVRCYKGRRYKLTTAYGTTTVEPPYETVKESEIEPVDIKKLKLKENGSVSRCKLEIK